MPNIGSRWIDHLNLANVDEAESVEELSWLVVISTKCAPSSALHRKPGQAGEGIRLFGS